MIWNWLLVNYSASNFVQPYFPVRSSSTILDNCLFFLSLSDIQDKEIDIGPLSVIVGRVSSSIAPPIRFNSGRDSHIPYILGTIAYGVRMAHSIELKKSLLLFIISELASCLFLCGLKQRTVRKERRLPVDFQLLAYPNIPSQSTPSRWNDINRLT